MSYLNFVVRSLMRRSCTVVYSLDLVSVLCVVVFVCFFFFQAEDGIRDLVRSRGLGDVYKRQGDNGMEEKEKAPRRAFTPEQKFEILKDVERYPIPVSYTHMTLPTIYSV